jgi:hypothetical protein
MSINIEQEFNGSAAAETPLVIAYVVAMTILMLGWSSIKPPATSILELRSTAVGNSQLARNIHDFAP